MGLGTATKEFLVIEFKRTQVAGSKSSNCAECNACDPQPRATALCISVNARHADESRLVPLESWGCDAPGLQVSAT